MQHRTIAGVEIRRNNQHVVARLERLDRRPPDILCVQPCQPRHVESVGHHNSLESHFFFQQSVHNRLGGCRHPVRLRIKRRHGDVRHHHRIYARLDRALKRRQFNRLQSRPVARDLRNPKMRVGRGFAVSREMLGRGQHSSFVSAANVRRHEIAHLLRVFSKRTYVDDGICRVGIHIRHREKIPVHPDRSGFKRRNAPEDFGMFGFSGSRKGHGMRKHRRSIYTHGQTALKVRRDQQRQLRRFLQPVEQFSGNIRLALEQNRALHRNRHHQRSDVILENVVPQLNPFRVGVVQELRQHLDPKKLPNFFFRRHLAQRLLGPLLAAFVEMNGSRRLNTILALVFTPRKAGRGQQKCNQKEMSKHAIEQ